MFGDYHNLMCYTTGTLLKYASIYIYHEFSPLKIDRYLEGIEINPRQKNNAVISFN